jgi:hypothetical protein
VHVSGAELRQRDERGRRGGAGADDAGGVERRNVFVGEGGDEAADIGVEPTGAVGGEQQVLTAPVSSARRPLESEAS